MQRYNIWYGRCIQSFLNLLSLGLDIQQMGVPWHWAQQPPMNPRDELASPLGEVEVPRCNK